MFNGHAARLRLHPRENVPRAFLLRVGAIDPAQTIAGLPQPTFYTAGGHGWHDNQHRYAARFFNGAVVPVACENHQRPDNRTTFSTSRGQCSSAVQSDLAPAHPFTCSAGQAAPASQPGRGRRTLFQRSAAKTNAQSIEPSPRCTFLKLAAILLANPRMRLPPTSSLYGLLAAEDVNSIRLVPASHPISARRTHHEQ